MILFVIIVYYIMFEVMEADCTYHPHAGSHPRSHRWQGCSNLLVCNYIYIYTHECISLSLYIYIYIYTYIHMYIHTHCHICNISLSLYIYIYMYTYIHTYIHMYVCVYTYIHIYIYMNLLVMNQPQSTEMAMQRASPRSVTGCQPVVEDVRVL